MYFFAIQIIPDILLQVYLFYQNWNIPTILEMVSKCICIMTSNLEGHEQNICFKYIKDITEMNINILKTGVENLSENVILLIKYYNK